MFDLAVVVISLVSASGIEMPAGAPLSPLALRALPTPLPLTLFALGSSSCSLCLLVNRNSQIHSGRPCPPSRESAQKVQESPPHRRSSFCIRFPFLAV